ncbi:Component of the Dot/Icm secretion system [Legionella fallonii LLAP-10]|uniref:Component of the Dot/Icm secretion system n=2 Tax=Legionella fallonii TaxID=96230 RepID=A0A098G6B6_9GAMM|nr:Component of the Dot/Icm secretion system [Legionella fallonii LLAP-10]
MAEHDQDNDEYKFAELDSLDSESMGEENEAHQSFSPGQKQAPGGKNVKRNALIAVGIIVFAMATYKIVGWIYSGKTNNASQVTPTPTAQITQQPSQSAITPAPSTTPTSISTAAPIVQPTQSVVTTTDNDLKQKVSAIEQAQQTVRAEVSSVGEQVGTVNNNINNLNTQIANLNQVIGNLTNQVAKQSEVINVLMARSQPKVVHKTNKKIIAPRIIYYIQAVIPGRAWLIGTNGSTLTVREGTKIAGYGRVRLIDSMQGRVLTSSGQVIKFSQEDS